MILFRQIILVIALCGPAFCASPDTLYDMVLAGDHVAVDAALNDAVDLDAKSGKEPDLHVGLFGVFEATDPSIDTFTANWLAQSPASANAMTARGWYLYAFGQAMGASGYKGRVYPAALEAKFAYHRQALSLFEAAHTASPNLVSAANGILQLTATQGSTDVTPAALIDILAVHPNRGSLMRAMAALPSYWAGNGEQITQLCKSYAAKIKSVVNYDLNTCLVDAIYSKGFLKTDKRDVAHELLQLTPHPILDYARLMDVLAGYGSAKQRMEILLRQQKTRVLTPEEASVFDEVTRSLNRDKVVTSIAYAQSLAPDLAARKLRVARDPYNAAEVIGYVKALQNAASVTDTAYPEDNATRLLQALLTKVSYSGEAWLTLANTIRGDALDPNGRLARIAAAEPYYTNAIAYSLGNYDVLEAAIDAKGWAVANPANPKLPTDLSALTPAELEQLDRTFHCPLAITYLLLSFACSAGETPPRCGIQHPAQTAIHARMTSVYQRGACKTELGAVPTTLPAPVKIDF